MKLNPTVCLILLSLGSSLTSANDTPKIAENAPNVVIIFGDDMPPTHVGAYGGDYLTPAIDQLADEGIRFNQAFCVSSMCTPSRFSMLSGKYPGRSRTSVFMGENPIGEAYSVAWNTGFSDGEVSMGRIFSELGYQTAFVGKWHLSKAEELGEIPEIDPDADPTDPDVQEQLQQLQQIQADYVKKVSGFNVVNNVLWENFDNDGMPIKALRAHNFEWILNGALDFLDSVEKDRPFLMLFASTAVHGPTHDKSLKANPHVSPGGHVELPSDYYPSRKQILNEVQARGDVIDPHIQAGMLSLDYQVAGICKKLQEQGLDENTIIIYLSDHGIEPGKGNSYLRGTRIPFIVFWQGQELSIQTSEAIVQIPDILPTLWDLATDGTEFPASSIDGHSFANVLREGGDSERDFAYFENGYTRSVFRDGYHYIAWRYPKSLIQKMRNGELKEAPDHLGTFDNGHSSIAMEKLQAYWDPDQFYDLSVDPYELHNAYNDQRYRSIIESLRDDLASVTNTFEHPFDLAGGTFQYSAKFDALKQPRIERGTSYIYWYTPGMHAWPPKEKSE